VDRPAHSSSRAETERPFIIGERCDHHTQTSYGLEMFRGLRGEHYIQRVEDLNYIIADHGIPNKKSVL
jgi:hypothetical protein